MASPTSSYNPPWYVSGLAGALGQVAELSLGGQILNRIATAQQANPSAGIVSSMRAIHQQNGFRGFFTGFRWNVGMSFCKGFTRWSINNALFSLSDRLISKNIQKEHSWIVPVMVGIGGAAFETTLYLCPLESLKTREMTENWGQKTHMWKVVKADGVAIFFRGWTGLFPRQALSWGTYLVVYDKYRVMMMSMHEGPATKIDKFMMSFMTGVTAALFTTPFDLYKTQMQKLDPISEKKMLRSMHFIYQNYGWQGIYRSLPMRIARSGCYAGATFTVMDYFNALPSRMKI